jgi:hypothetical protein
VFSRAARRGPLPAGKTVKVEIRRGTSAVIEAAEFEWTVAGKDAEEIQAPSPMRLMGMGSNGAGGGLNYGLLPNQPIREFAHPIDIPYICSGETRIEIPKDATVIMKKPFVAYYHATPKGNVGYLRIPHYYPETPEGKSEVETLLNWFNQYEFAVQELEKNTVGLIIDQDHNCGGYVWLVNKMISLFMDRPFAPSQFELLASKESYLSFEKEIKDVPESTIGRANFEKVLKLIKETWHRGDSYLTPKTPIDGEETFPNNFVHYTKPVVVLIDEAAGSGGDMFPAMIKGLGRAKLFGQTTSGLGGHVEEYPAGLPNSQMHFNMTKSLFYRPDGVAVENNGAVPDRFYTITRDDLLYGYKNYQREYLAYLLEMVN